MELAPLTVLNKRFTVKRTLQDPGPYDIAYLGEDVDAKDPYVIREFFPIELVKRASGTTSVEVKPDADAVLFASGREYFQKESEVLAELRHPSLPSGFVPFDANGTTYRARPRASGLSMAEGLEVKGTLSERAALTIMIPVLEGLMEAHDRGLYHGGVSPEVIRVLENGSVLLTGFQGAFIQLAREQGELSSLLRPGTSAIEQYTPRGNQGPWTDVYAVAATITQIVTGRDVPEASQRLEDDDPLSVIIQDADAFSTPGVREALIDALTVDPSKRLQTAEALRDALKDSSTRYDEDQKAYSILPVEPEADASPGDDEDVEVLSTQSDDRPARASSTASSSESSSGDASSDSSTDSSTGLGSAERADAPSGESSSGESSSQEAASTPDASEESSAPLVAWVVGLPLLIFALGGATWFLMLPGGASAGGDEAGQETSAASTSLRARADSLYQNAEYQAARRAYRQVLQRRGDDEEVQQRLSRIDQMMAESSDRRYQRSLSRGDSLKRQADSLLAEGEGEQANTVYSRAMAAYFSALDARTGDAMANQKIDQIERRQESIARQQASRGGGSVDVTEIVRFFQSQAEAQLQEGNLQAALRKYRQAAEYAEDNQKLNQIIADLEQEIEEQERTESYKRAYERGVQLLQEEQYAEAKVELTAALDVDSTQEARAALRRADSLLTEEETGRETTYASFRSAGDRALERGSLETALQAYRQALDAKPDDPYVQQQMEKVKAQQSRSSSEGGETAKKEEWVGPDGVYRIVDQDPKPKGGIAALHRGVEYPERAARNGIEGRVYVKALVGDDGKVKDAEVARGIGGGCDQEALRVVKRSEFIPAKVDGEPVPNRTTVWIQFSLKENR